MGFRVCKNHCWAGIVPTLRSIVFGGRHAGMISIHGNTHTVNGENVAALGICKVM